MSNNISIDLSLSKAEELLKKRLLLDLAYIGIECGAVETKGIINTIRLRNLMIRKEYDQRRKQGEKAEALYSELGERYELDYITVRGIVHHKKREMK